MENEKLYLTILDNLTNGVYFVNRERQITFWNQAAEDITGYSREEMQGRFCAESLLEHVDKEGNPLCIVGCPLYETMEDGARRQDEVLVRHKKGHRIPIIVTAIPIYSDENKDEIVGAVELFTPAAPHIYEANLLESLSEQESTNPLALLPRRKFLERLLNFKLDLYKRFSHKFCVAIAEIDNAEQVIETYGREMYDDVLSAIGKSIRHSLPQGDSFGSWGDNVFLGIFDINTNGEAKSIGNQIQMLINRSEVVENGERLIASVSVGVSIIQRDDSFESITKRAEALMNISRKEGGNFVSIEETTLVHS